MPQKKDLKRLNSLKEKGFLTEDEYKKALSQMDGVGASSRLKHTANEPLVQGTDLSKQKGPLPKDARQAILRFIGGRAYYCIQLGIDSSQRENDRRHFCFGVVIFWRPFLSRQKP